MDQIVEKIREAISSRSEEPGSRPIARLEESLEPLRQARSLDASLRVDGSEHAETLARLERESSETVAWIGVAPPAPPTFRGKLGNAIVAALQRMMWWHSHAVKQALDVIVHRNQEDSRQLAVLRQQVSRLVEIVGEEQRLSREAREHLNDFWQKMSMVGQARRDAAEAAVNARATRQEIHARVAEIEASILDLQSRQLELATLKLAESDELLNQTRSRLDALEGQLNARVSTGGQPG